MSTEMPDNHPHHIPALDGLRGVAILMVILWHYVFFLHSFFPGWEGVDLFFVLSGYLITGRLQQTEGRPRYISRFYRNRLLRIVPLYYTVVIGYLAGICLFVRKIHLPLMVVYLHHWQSLFLFTANWTFIRVGVPKDISLVPLWSVAMEMQFYLVWPLLFVLTTAKSRLKWLPTLILLVLLGRAIAWYLNPQPFESINYNSFFRLDCFAAGALLYQLHDARITLPIRWVKRAIVLLLAAGVVGMLASGSVSPGAFFSLGGYTVSALFFAALLHLATQPHSGAFHRFLETPFLRFCGKISYGLYLVHLPILINIAPRISSLWPASWLSKIPLLSSVSDGICLALSFLVSALSYRYFESYFLRLKRASPSPASAGRPAKTTTFET